jgi:hypothetical protein
MRLRRCAWCGTCESVEMKLSAIITIAALAVVIGTAAVAEPLPQTRLYDARGNSIGTAAPQGNGTVRYYDNRGNSLGTSTTSLSGTRTFYGPRGNVTGRAFRSK